MTTDSGGILAVLLIILGVSGIWALIGLMTVGNLKKRCSKWGDDMLAHVDNQQGLITKMSQCMDDELAYINTLHEENVALLRAAMLAHDVLDHPEQTDNAAWKAIAAIDDALELVQAGMEDDQ